MVFNKDRLTEGDVIGYAVDGIMGALGVLDAELVLGLLLIVGLWRKPTAVLAAVLTLSFALSMTVVLGPDEPLNYSVFVFVFASLYLGLSQDVE
jgi:uncharacterized membrane protein YphA (DoxX/SURF4 family)